MASEALKKAVCAEATDQQEEDDDPVIGVPRLLWVNASHETLKEGKESDPVPGVISTVVGPECKDKRKKVILLVGDGNSCMEAWINGVINYVLGVEFEEDYRFMWVKDDVVYNWVRIQTLNHQEGARIDYSLVIIYIPLYTAGMLSELDIPDVDEFYYMCDAEEICNKKLLKMFGRDMSGLGNKWTLLITGHGMAALEHIAKTKEDLRSYTGRYILFPDPNSVLTAGQDDLGGAMFYNTCMKGYGKMFQQ